MRLPRGARVRAFWGRSGVAGRRAEAGKAVKPSGVEVRSLRVRGPAGGLQNFRSSESLASEKRTAALNKCSLSVPSAVTENCGREEPVNSRPLEVPAVWN
ncbi:hypothetical protein R6Z07M_015159 [Ovis aries]